MSDLSGAEGVERLLRRTTLYAISSSFWDDQSFHQTGDEKDCTYEGHQVCVELDGELTHPGRMPGTRRASSRAK